MTGIKFLFWKNAMELTGRKILVTGASSGIGRAIAIMCAQKGAEVILGYRKNIEGAQETLIEIEKYSSGFIVGANLSDEIEVLRVFKEIKQQVGEVDILVNNAGEAVFGDLFDNKLWKYELDNIFFSALYTTQQFLKQNTDCELRKILNISSIYGNLNTGNPDFFAYSAAKAALSNFTVTLAKTSPNVQVNAIAPGYTLTPAWNIPEEDKRECVSRKMINRFITPEEVAKITVSVLENDAITGQVITIDGGLNLGKSV